MAWAREHRVAADDELTYLREYEHITLARVLLAENAATGSSEACSKPYRTPRSAAGAAENGGRIGTVIELEVLRAVALHAPRSDATQALEALGARCRARRGGRLGPGLRRLGTSPDDRPLRELATRQPRSGYTRELLAAVAAAGERLHRRSRRGAGIGTGTRLRVGLVDPLSDRELDVLRLLGSDLDGPAIARELVVSLNTVRTHTKHIYTKLGVNNRRAAVSRAHQLGLLRRERPR